MIATLAAGCGGAPAGAGGPSSSTSTGPVASIAPPPSASPGGSDAPPPKLECDVFMDLIARTSALRATIHRDASSAGKAQDWAAKMDALADEVKALHFDHPDLETERAALASRMTDLVKDLRALAALEKGQTFGATNAAHSKVLKTSEQIEVITREPAARCGGETKKLQDVTGRLAPSEIQRVVRARFSSMRLCYEEGLRRDPTLTGRVSVRFVIGRDGKVAAAGPYALEDASSTDAAPAGVAPLPPMRDAAVTACVVDLFKQLVFPQPDGGIVTVVYPIMFSPSD